MATIEAAAEAPIPVLRPVVGATPPPSAPAPKLAVVETTTPPNVAANESTTVMPKCGESPPITVVESTIVKPARGVDSTTVTDIAVAKSTITRPKLVENLPLSGVDSTPQSKKETNKETILDKEMEYLEMTEIQTTWQAVLTRLRRQMLKGFFDRWLKNTKPLAFVEDTWQIGVSSHLAKDWLEHQLKRQVQQALALEIGNDAARVVFVVPLPSN